jgi:hypothetical protein
MRPYAYLLLLLLGVSGASGLLIRWLVKRKGVDEAWAPTGIRQIYTGHDEAKATAAAKRHGQTSAQMAEQDRIARMKKSNLRQVGKQA